MNQHEAELVDELVGEAIGLLPGPIQDRLEMVPVVVLDRPEPGMLLDLGIDPVQDPHAADEICGLHTGVPITERSVESTDVPDVIHLFRAGLIALAHETVDSEYGREHGLTFELALSEEISITLLHELGHHFGLDEDDLERMGYA